MSVRRASNSGGPEANAKTRPEQPGISRNAPALDEVHNPSRPESPPPESPRPGSRATWASPREIELAAIAQSDPGGAAGRKALGELLGPYQRPIYALVYRMVNNPEVARDLTQDTLAKAIQNFASYDGKSRLTGWLFRIASNTCVSYFRRQKHRSHASLDGPIGTGSGSDDSAGRLGDVVAVSREPEAGSGVEQGEALVMMSRALSSLAPLHRAVLIMRDAHGMEYSLIAEALDISIGTVKSRLFRARAALREAIEAQGGPAGPGPTEDEGEVPR